MSGGTADAWSRTIGGRVRAQWGISEPTDVVRAAAIKRQFAAEGIKVDDATALAYAAREQPARVIEVRSRAEWDQAAEAIDPGLFVQRWQEDHPAEMVTDEVTGERAAMPPIRVQREGRWLGWDEL